MLENVMGAALLATSVGVGVLLLRREPQGILLTSSTCTTCRGSGRLGWGHDGRLPVTCPECGKANLTVSDELDGPARWR